MASNQKARPHDGDGDDDRVTTRIQSGEDEDEDYDGGFEYDDAADDVMDDAEDVVHLNAPRNKYHRYGHRGGAGGVEVVARRTGELTLSFEGEVYVFPAVTPEKVLKSNNCFPHPAFLFYMLTESSLQLPCVFVYIISYG